jgi:hypothetical protein
MLKHWLLLTLFCVCLGPTIATGQNLCPTGTTSDKLICLLPATFENGLTLKSSIHQGHFGAESFLSNGLTPLNSALATQSVLLPIGSPSSALTFTWDSAAKVFVPSTDSLGPVLGERAETIGRHRLSVGVSYQYFKFDSLDGLNLKANLPSVFTHVDDSADAPPNTTCSINPPDTTNNELTCGFVRDVIKTNSRFDMKIHEVTTVATYGITGQIDVSVAIPIKEVRMGVSSNATIVNNSLSFDHLFPTPNCAFPCETKAFAATQTASGIGDITLRVKGEAWTGEKSAVALGVDVRVPTGDQLNFLGAGAAGVRPFFVYSRRSRISPNLQVGYEVNGSSVVAGDVLTGNKQKLPSALTYAGGADVWLTKWLTAAFDLTGQQVFQAQRMTITTFQELGGCKNPNCDPNDGFNAPNPDPNLTKMTGSYNLTNASVGAKVRPVAGLVITLNAEIKLNDGGLRSRFTPLVGVGYTF